jgi:hypothetical protein
MYFTIQGFSALHLAARANKEDVVHLLLQASIIYRRQSKLSASIKQVYRQNLLRDRTYRGRNLSGQNLSRHNYRDITYQRYNISGLNLIGRQILSANKTYWDRTCQLDQTNWRTKPMGGQNLSAGSVLPVL